MVGAKDRDDGEEQKSAQDKKSEVEQIRRSLFALFKEDGLSREEIQAKVDKAVPPIPLTLGALD